MRVYGIMRGRARRVYGTMRARAGHETMASYEGGPGVSMAY